MAVSDEYGAIAWLKSIEDAEAVALRENIGKLVCGQDASWYEYDNNLETLEGFLAGGYKDVPDLGFAFQNISDESLRIDWLKLVDEKARWVQEQESDTESADTDPEEQEEIAEEPAEPEQPRYGTPEYDEDYGLYYVFDAESRVYLWSLDPAAPIDQWMNQSAADAYAAQHRPVDEEDSGDLAEEASQWAWDDGWGMFYRIGPAGVYEYSNSVDEAHTAPDGVWLSGEQVAQQRLLSAGQEEPETRTEPGAGPVSEVARPEDGEVDVATALERLDALGVDAVRDVVKDLDELFAAITELGIGV